LFNSSPEADERPYIDAIIEQGGIDPYYIHGDELAPLDNLEEMLWRLDQPLHNGNMFVVWELYRVAMQQGVRALLDGAGGDKTMGDTTAQVAELVRSGQWTSAYQEMKGLANLYGLPTREVFWITCVKNR
jgi:asparagine synthase (glutamine-hydrolysing)